MKRTPRFNKRHFAAFARYLTKMVSKEWVDQHPEIVAAWWMAPIAGGMFKAGIEYARRTKP